MYSLFLFLVKFRSSLGLRTKYWPLKTDPCLKWIGIECENGSITGINISGFKRTQNANRNPTFSFDSLGELTKLVSFNASGFSLHGSIPNWVGVRFQNLQFLDLRCCEITGGIPFIIGNLSNLRELYLSDNRFTGSIPSSLGLLSQLRVLDVSRNALTGFIPDDFGNLASLVVLDLSSNLFSGPIPTEFGRLKNLQRMLIHENSFTGELHVALWLLPSLRFLDVSDNKFIGSLPNISCNGNATMAVFNLSHNMFDGMLTSVLKRVLELDLHLLWNLFKYAGLDIDNLQNLECCLFVLFPYFSYMLAEGLGLSGIVSILFTGMVMKHYSFSNLSENSQKFVAAFFHLISSLAETFVFIYIGFDIAMEQHSWSHIGFIFFSIIFIGLARAANVTCAYLLNLVRPAQRQIPVTHQKALWYSDMIMIIMVILFQ